VFYKGAKLGRAPGLIRAPVGRTQLQLVNTGKEPHIKWSVTCDVSDAEIKECTTQLP